MERRASERFVVERPCLVRGAGIKGTLFLGSTVNLSRWGALIRIGTEMSVGVKTGDQLAVEILLEPNGTVERKSMYCEGVVKRSGNIAEHQWQVAVEFGRVRFRRASATLNPKSVAAVM